MQSKIVKVSRPIALSLCMNAWLLAGNAHAANSHLYSAVGCLGSYPDVKVARVGGALERDEGADVVCPIITDANSTQLKVTVFYETRLFASATYAGKPFYLACTLQGYDPATKTGHYDFKSVQPAVHNRQNVSGSFKLSMIATHQLNVLYCELPDTPQEVYFRVLGYQVDES